MFDEVTLSLAFAFIEFPKPGGSHMGHQHCVLWLVFLTGNQFHLHSGKWELDYSFLMKKTGVTNITE